MSAVVDFAQAFRAAGRGFVIVRQAYRAGDQVRVKATGVIGAFDRYEIETGRVRLFVRGSLQVFDQASVEPAGSAVDIRIKRVQS